MYRNHISIGKPQSSSIRIGITQRVAQHPATEPLIGRRRFDKKAERVEDKVVILSIHEFGAKMIQEFTALRSSGRPISRQEPSIGEMRRSRPSASIASS